MCILGEIQTTTSPEYKGISNELLITKSALKLGKDSVGQRKHWVRCWSDADKGKYVFDSKYV